MKTKINILTLFIALLAGFTPAKVQAQASVSFQVFYDELDPYGQWVQYPSYGYVWVPSAGPDFMPYSSGGYWAWTEYGWTWVSDYSWGWAPFHYGRWDFVDYYGWVWVPGNEWGPAWVVWRDSPGYYGWAPLSPGISVNVVIGGGYSPPPDHWVFVDNHYMGDHNIHHHYGPRGNNTTYINNSTVINNTYVDNSTHNTYITGPRSEQVQKQTGKPVQTVAVRNASKPGQAVRNNQLDIYRPEVARGEEGKVKPARIADKKDVAPVHERKNNAAQPARQAQPVQRDATQPARKPDNINKATQPQRNTNTNTPKQAPAQRQNTQPQKRVQQPAQQQKPVERRQPANQPVPQPKRVEPQRQPQPQVQPQVQPQRQAPPVQERPQPQRQVQPQPQQQPQQRQPQNVQPAPQPAPQPQPRPAMPNQRPRPH